MAVHGFRTVLAAAAASLLAIVVPAQGFGVVRGLQPINREEGGFRPHNALGLFGAGVAPLGDFDGDGIEDVAAGSPLFSTDNVGSAWILFLRRDGTVRTHRRIGRGVGGFTREIDAQAELGSSIANLGDVDGDGIVDLAIGAEGDSAAEPLVRDHGAVWICFLNADGTVRTQQKIDPLEGGLPPGILPSSSAFGHSVAAPGDLDGDGTNDLVVGAWGRSKVYLLLLERTGTVKAATVLGAADLGLPEAEVSGFGSAVAALGDLDGDGGLDLAVGASSASNDCSVASSGAVFLLFLDAAQQLVRYRRIDCSNTLAGSVVGHAAFGRALGSVGDLDGDGIAELAVGAGFSTGTQKALWVLSLTSDGSVRTALRLDEGVAGHELQGMMVPVGDLDLDGVKDMIVGSPYERGSDGTLYVLFRCITTALAEIRNPGGVNPLSYSCAAPAIATNVELSVDLSTTGHAVTTILGFAGALTATLGGGQTLLMDVSHPSGELLRLPLRSGPLATYELQIPRQLSLCGLRVSTQALHLFRVQPYALSNAVDLTLGPAGTAP